MMNARTSLLAVVAFLSLAAFTPRRLGRRLPPRQQRPHDGRVTTSRAEIVNGDTRRRLDVTRAATRSPRWSRRRGVW